VTLITRLEIKEKELAIQFRPILQGNTDLFKNFFLEFEIFLLTYKVSNLTFIPKENNISAN